MNVEAHLVVRAAEDAYAARLKFVGYPSARGMADAIFVGLEAIKCTCPNTATHATECPKPHAAAVLEYLRHERDEVE